jgi:hypothetical protein
MHKKDGSMSFKNLSVFNVAMLGKQGCRIMTNPNTLISRLYKAKYYPHCDFLEATLGHKLNFVWRSIFKSKFNLRAGTRWKIGSGENIPVWHNEWIDGASHLFHNLMMVLP